MAPAPPFPNHPSYPSNNEPAPTASAMAPPPPYNDIDATSPAAVSVNSTMPKAVVPASSSAAINSRPFIRRCRCLHSHMTRRWWHSIPVRVTRRPSRKYRAICRASTYLIVALFRRACENHRPDPRPSPFISTPVATPTSGRVQFSQSSRVSAAPTCSSRRA